MTNFFRSFVLTFALLALTSIAGADPIYTVTMNGPQSSVNNGDSYVGPFSLTVNGTDMFGTCITDFIHIYAGQTWIAKKFSVTDFTNPQRTQILQTQWLNQQFSLEPTTNWVAIHQAIWDIFDPGKYTDAKTLSYLQQAQLNYNSVQTNSFFLLIPEPNFRINEGVSQTFLVTGSYPNPPSQVPEPTPVLMLGMGVGLIFLGRIGRSRLLKQ